LNIFYAPPSQIHGSLIELKGREAGHASKVLRYAKGDSITVVDGKGNLYEGKIYDSTGGSVQIRASGEPIKNKNRPNVRLAAGIIKKQDRLEFIVEKAVELGVRELIFFRGEHSVKQNMRLGRLKSIAVSAMKQSLRAWLPNLQVYNSLEEILKDYSTCNFIAARQGSTRSFGTIKKKDLKEKPCLLIGPEGGLSKNELDHLQKQEAQFISLGTSRLRTETAAITGLAQYYGCLTK
jgi:16S rRNA (uracil1498-N3)-methyltransferase